MQICESTDCEPRTHLIFKSNASNTSDLLDVEVAPGKKGLQVLRIGEKSPFCRLKPLGYFKMRGLVEMGDCIIAIDGVLLQSPTDLTKLVHQRNSCEVTIFDHRTRLTVSWRIHFREMLESA